ncbi:Hypothetical_protein [Hexamita inflata]|uniref:Hypothetical_protein n=1 Tax=Hexamita inflata TaxID=28002 RepID=A0AA86P5A7_9EUKA|nr:Hypothetical protein HINF_LOCUS18758 [Hexamita inflata]
MLVLRFGDHHILKNGHVGLFDLFVQIVFVLQILMQDLGDRLYQVHVVVELLIVHHHHLHVQEHVDLNVIAVDLLDVVELVVGLHAQQVLQGYRSQTYWIAGELVHPFLDWLDFVVVERLALLRASSAHCAGYLVPVQHSFIVGPANRDYLGNFGFGPLFVFSLHSNEVRQNWF